MTNMDRRAAPTQNADVRERIFNMRLSDEEHARFERVASHYALNVAGLVRMLVKREDDAIASREPKRAQKKPAKTQK